MIAGQHFLRVKALTVCEFFEENSSRYFIGFSDPSLSKKFSKVCFKLGFSPHNFSIINGNNLTKSLLLGLSTNQPMTYQQKKEKTACKRTDTAYLVHIGKFLQPRFVCLCSFCKLLRSKYKLLGIARSQNEQSTSFSCLPLL